MNDREKTGVITALLILAIGLLIGVLVICGRVTGAELAGDTVQLLGVFRDENGVAAVPTSARGFVFRDSLIVDSTATIANDGITRYHRVLKWEYTIPSAAADSVRYSFLIRASNATITDDWFACVPASISFMDAITDSITPAASVDYAVGAGSNEWAVVDSTEGGGIYASGGAAITGAFVFVTTDSTLTDFIAHGKSVLGNYYIWAPLDPAAADTMYVSAWYQNNWVKLWAQVINPS